MEITTNNIIGALSGFGLGYNIMAHRIFSAVLFLLIALSVLFIKKITLSKEASQT